ncbi:MAG TPA: Ig-like domain-containing protein, partial [Tenuifilaceae bacterium]|nr:Ig-like domain-containing protein [Tenuifilaceae bacterium]
MSLHPYTNKMKICFVSILFLLLASAGFSQPIATITSGAASPTNQNPIPITIEFNAEVVDFIDTDIVVSGGTIGNFSTADNIVFTFDLTPFSDGVCTVDIPADVCTDVSFNPNLASTQFSIEYDGTAPMLNTVTIISNNMNSGYAKVGDDVTLTFTSSETLVVTSVVINGNIVTPVEGLPNEWTATYVATEGDAEGIIPFTIDFSDVAGNTGVTVTSTTDASQVTFDNTAPGGYTVSFDQADINATNQTESSFTVNGAEVGATLNYTISSDGGGTDVAASGAITTSSQNFSPIDVSGLGDGTLTLTVTLTDVAGNVGAAETASISKNTSGLSLVAYYPFNGNANDESGSGYNGTPYNTTLVNDRFDSENSAYYFDGASSSITIGNQLGLINGSSPFTLSAWIYPEDFVTQQHTILGERDGGDNYQFAVHNSSIYFSYWDMGVESAFEGKQLSIGAWQLLTVTYDGNYLNLYVDGELDQSHEVVINIDNNPSNLYIGTYDGSNMYFLGNIDEVRIYSYALSESEVVDLYHEGGWDQVTDIDGNIYPTVSIGNQEWFAQNLRTANYANGEPITSGLTDIQWSEAATGALAVYPYTDITGFASDAEVLEAYGALYNWYAVNDVRGL